ncbi:MAG: flagellar hook-associated protein FlgL [Proteobacteria bacterium]|nr:flagellar hook-associated protein FlgL [Pseudomonadota bacterium]
MRVSESQRYHQVEGRVERAKNANAKAMDDISTLKTIRDISDNPVGVTRSIRYRDQISTMDQHVKNMELSKGFMQKSEDALTNLSENLMRAKELAVGMSNDTYNASSRQASAREVRELIDEVVLVGNAQFANRFVFAGFRNGTPPLSADGNYVGDDGSLFVQVAPGSFRPINLNARNLFEPTPEERLQGHGNLVHSMEAFYESLMENDKAGIQRALEEIDFHLEKTTSFQASIGGMFNAIHKTQDRTEKDIDFAKGTLSQIEDVDVFKATSDFKKTEATLQSTLLASNKVLQPSLLNFMQ